MPSHFFNILLGGGGGGGGGGRGVFFSPVSVSVRLLHLFCHSLICVVEEGVGREVPELLQSTESIDTIM